MEELPQLLEANPSLTSINLEFSEIESLDSYMPWLAQFSELEELLLFGNRLESLPSDMSSLRNLQKLDISNNIFPSLDVILPGLSSLPSLHDLHITLQSEEEEQLLLEALPLLQKLNGADIATERPGYSERPSSNDEENLSLQQKDLETVAIIYDQIREKWKSIDPSSDDQLAEDFDVHVKQTIGNLSAAVKQGPASHIVHSYIIRAKFELFKICQEKLIGLAGDNADLLKNTAKLMNGLFDELLEVMLNIQPRFQEKMDTMKREADKARRECQDLMEAADQEARKHREEIAKLKQAFAEEREETRYEIESLQEENKKYLDFVLKRSKNSANQVLAGKVIENRANTSSVNARNVSLVSNPRILSLRQLKEVIDEIYASKSKFDKRCTDGKLPRETMEQHMYTFLNQKYGLKTLIVEWASAIIAGIKQYSTEDNDVAVFGKILRNECDEEFRFVQLQVKETVAELLKMHLKGKFPLKTNSDISEIQREKMEGFVNEEEWTDIVRYMYNDTDSELLVNLIFEVIEMKNYPSDLPPVRVKMTREEAQLRKEKERLSKGRIAYADLLKILLDFQLKGHEKFLSKFIGLFRRIDRDANGIVNEREFRELVASMDLEYQEQDNFRLLQIIDPYENQQITFSECVALFSSEQVPLDELNPDDTVSILQKLSLRDDIF